MCYIAKKSENEPFLTYEHHGTLIEIYFYYYLTFCLTYTHFFELLLLPIVGGWITTSNITATIEPNKRSLVVLCHGINMQLAENAVATHTVNILRKYLIFFYFYDIYL